MGSAVGLLCCRGWPNTTKQRPWPLKTYQGALLSCEPEAGPGFRASAWRRQAWKLDTLTVAGVRGASCRPRTCTMTRPAVTSHSAIEIIASGHAAALMWWTAVRPPHRSMTKLGAA